jgi:hypothetical protein
MESAKHKKFSEMTDADFSEAVDPSDVVLPLEYRTPSPVDWELLRTLDRECMIVRRALDIIADRLKDAQRAGIELRVREDRCIEIAYPESMDTNTRIEHHRNLDHHSWHIRQLLEGRARNVEAEKTIVTACLYAGDAAAVERYIAGGEAVLWGAGGSRRPEFSVPIVAPDPITFGELADQVAEFGLWGVTALSFDLAEMNRWLAEGCTRERLIEIIREQLAQIALAHAPTIGRGH